MRAICLRILPCILQRLDTSISAHDENESIFKCKSIDARPLMDQDGFPLVQVNKDSENRPARNAEVAFSL
jgi:hypothetical protein